MDKYRFIEVYDEDGVRWIYFNRPDKLNSFNNGLMNEVIDVLE
ncbi:TPA: enoyl-CoA hydratase/isomerase family protein [Candidatus Geothermarchaeota archaeon]|nr:enoyl-CoA hydratase/isomerase family protein [Candidatus Geothermarchaeota archaeon]